MILPPQGSLMLLELLFALQVPSVLPLQHPDLLLHSSFRTHPDTEAVHPEPVVMVILQMQKHFLLHSQQTRIKP